MDLEVIQAGLDPGWFRICISGTGISKTFNYSRSQISHMQNGNNKDIGWTFLKHDKCSEK